jgi:hypothetical protein
MMGIPASVVALTTAQALAASASAQAANTVQAHVKSRRIGFGKPVVVTGRVPAADTGHPLELQFLPAGATQWQSLSSTTAPPDGRYRLSAPLRHSGFVRVLDTSGGSSPTSPAIGRASSAVSSATQRVAVSAALRVRPRSIRALGGGRVTVHGHLAPALSGRVIRLDAHGRGGWRTVAVTRTGAGGRFTLRFTPAGGVERIRVRFSGDRLNAKATASAGTVGTYQAALASWYNDGGTTGCGFHAFYGVANKSLPCGTRVQFLYGGRSVTAVVDDRGPYVGGREWDLNQNTAAALGFGGVGTVWSAF